MFYLLIPLNPAQVPSLAFFGTETQVDVSSNLMTLHKNLSSILHNFSCFRQLITTLLISQLPPTFLGKVTAPRLLIWRQSAAKPQCIPPAAAACCLITACKNSFANQQGCWWLHYNSRALNWLTHYLAMGPSGNISHLFSSSVTLPRQQPHGGFCFMSNPNSYPSGGL